MASESSFVQPAIPRFDGHYDHWSMLMENFLRSKEYWNLVETGIIAAAEGAFDRSILETILKKDTTKDIWDSLKQKYQGTARVKRAQLQALRKEFETLHMKAAESVNDYFGRTLIIANKMRIHGECMKDVVIIEKILRSMTPKYNYVVCSIEESNDLDILSIDELHSSLLVHEQRISRHVVIEEQALQMTYGAQQGGQDAGRNNYRGRGRGRGRGKFGFDKTAIDCYNCGELGHFQWECQRKARDQKANYAETREEMLLMAHVDFQQTETKHIWLLDFGCNNHMCGQRDIFFQFDSSFKESVMEIRPAKAARPQTNPTCSSAVTTMQSISIRIVEHRSSSTSPRWHTSRSLTPRRRKSHSLQLQGVIRGRELGVPQCLLLIDLEIENVGLLGIYVLLNESEKLYRIHEAKL
ncbi:uncharacterized protein [Populus alba]|uniref:uncharacterized protein n=1 Tax=Populus alba TaxID=43335 RepID=UPI003CC77BE2